MKSIILSQNSARRSRYELNGEGIPKSTRNYSVLRFRTKGQAIKYAKMFHPEAEIIDKT